jgi:Ca2+-binding RTX toxin-like protein
MAIINGSNDSDFGTSGLGDLIGTEDADTIFGLDGDDLMVGLGGIDKLVAGKGNDSVFGGDGDDVAYLDEGDDLFGWNPGEDNDRIEGGDGYDTMLFNGANINEQINMLANGERFTFLRDIANVVMDTNELEQVDFNALGGEDTITINDLTKTDIKQINLNLAALGSTAGDGAADKVILDASKHNDVVDISGVLGDVNVSGLSAAVKITGADLEQDLLTVNGLNGDDTIDATNLAVGAMKLLLDGGKGDDRLIGGGEDDTFIGGKGNDFVDGRKGDDTAFLGDGKDAFLWNPGEGNDVIEGEGGYDTMIFNGAGANETIDMLANGERFTFLRDIANVVMDTNELEQVDFQALGGTDTININDLSATDVKRVNVNLGLSLDTPGGDGQADTVNTNGSAGNDVIQIRSPGDEVVVSGLAAKVAIANADATLDKLVVSGGEGDDQLDGSRLKRDRIQLTLDGGAGYDSLLGSDGDDILLGGTGYDTLIGDKGADILTGGEGQDYFRYDRLNEAGDTITDFNAIDDQILIRGAGFGGGLMAGSPISVDQFTLGTSATDGSDRFIYNNTSGELYFDRDGTGSQSQVLLATLTGAPSINNTDIVVI